LTGVRGVCIFSPMSIFFGVVALSVFSFLLVCAVKAWLDASLECE
jgi:hypothetical protein